MTGMTKVITKAAQRIILKAQAAAFTVFFAAAVGAIVRGTRGQLIAPGATLSAGTSATASAS